MAKRSVAQEESLVTSLYLMAMMHLMQATDLRLHVRKIDVVFLTPETADSINVAPPATQKDYIHTYAIYSLSHLGTKKIAWSL